MRHAILDLAAAGGSIVVGAVAADGRPLAARAWSLDDAAASHGRSQDLDDLLVVIGEEAELLDALAPGTRIAITAADVLTYEAVQCRGEVVAHVALDEEGRVRARRRSLRFVERVAGAHLDRPEQVAAMVPVALTGVRIRPLEYFDQSPRSRVTGT